MNIGDTTDTSYIEQTMSTLPQQQDPLLLLLEQMQQRDLEAKRQAQEREEIARKEADQREERMLHMFQQMTTAAVEASTRQAQV